MRKLLLLLLLLAGCEGGWHPLDCAMGDSYSPDWCPEGTKGYQNEQAGRGRRMDPAVALTVLQMLHQPVPMPMYVPPPLPGQVILVPHY